MTQQNKGAVPKIFYNIRKNRVAYLEIKWKRQKDLQFGRLVVVVLLVGSSSSSSSSSRSRLLLLLLLLRVVAKEGKDTQNTQKKKKQRMKTDKKNAEIFYIFLVSKVI